MFFLYWRFFLLLFWRWSPRQDLFSVLWEAFFLQCNETARYHKATTQEWSQFIYEYKKENQSLYTGTTGSTCKRLSHMKLCLSVMKCLEQLISGTGTCVALFCLRLHFFFFNHQLQMWSTFLYETMWLQTSASSLNSSFILLLVHYIFLHIHADIVKW